MRISFKSALIFLHFRTVRQSSVRLVAILATQSSQFFMFGEARSTVCYLFRHKIVVAEIGDSVVVLLVFLGIGLFGHIPRQCFTGRVRQVACGGEFIVILSDGGIVSTMGLNNCYQLGNGTTHSNYDVPKGTCETQTIVRLTEQRQLCLGFEISEYQELQQEKASQSLSPTLISLFTVGEALPQTKMPLEG